MNDPRKLIAEARRIHQQWHPELGDQCAHLACDLASALETALADTERLDWFDEAVDWESIRGLDTDDDNLIATSVRDAIDAARGKL